MTDPWAPPPDQPSAPQPPAGDPPTQHLPPEPPTEAAPTAQLPPEPAPPPPPPADRGGRIRGLFRDPLSIVLAVVIVVTLAIAGVVGVELYARNKADTVVAGVAACVVQDNASASFGGATPFLWQHLNRHYGNIAIVTEGNRIRDMSGMKADIRLDDVRMADSGDSRGTIGAMTVTVTWTADGIRQTVQDQGPALVAALQEAFSQYDILPSGLLTFAQPLIESASKNLVSDVKTDPSSGVIELSGTLGHLSVKPTLEDGDLKLTPTDAGFSLPLLGDQPLPSESFQPLVDRFSARMDEELPLGLRPTSVTVTDNGIVAVLSATNKAIPKRENNDCYQGI